MKAVWRCVFGAYSNSLFNIQHHTAFQNVLNKYNQVYLIHFETVHSKFYYSKVNAEHKENFIICLKIFYSGLTEIEIKSMQQPYNLAYEKLWRKFKVDMAFRLI